MVRAAFKASRGVLWERRIKKSAWLLVIHEDRPRDANAPPGEHPGGPSIPTPESAEFDPPESEQDKDSNMILADLKGELASLAV